MTTEEIEKIIEEYLREHLTVFVEGFPKFGGVNVSVSLKLDYKRFTEDNYTVWFE